ncbi:unnamed protein product [Brassica rapa subsp. narinosa]
MVNGKPFIRFAPPPHALAQKAQGVGGDPSERHVGREAEADRVEEESP